jgi:nucleoside phosphorylase
MRYPPKAGAGKLAAGDAVLKSAAAMKQLLLLDKEITAVDMESGAVAKAVRALRLKAEVFAIRGISDNADEHKAQTEEAYADANRYWAMHNATTLLMSVLPRLDES